MALRSEEIETEAKANKTRGYFSKRQLCIPVSCLFETSSAQVSFAGEGRVKARFKRWAPVLTQADAPSFEK